MYRKVRDCILQRRRGSSVFFNLPCHRLFISPPHSEIFNSPPQTDFFRNISLEIARCRRKCFKISALKQPSYPKIRHLWRPPTFPAFNSPKSRCLRYLFNSLIQSEHFSNISVEIARYRRKCFKNIRFSIARRRRKFFLNQLFNDPPQADFLYKYGP